MKKFSMEEKEQILEESYKEGSVISELGKKYKMSPKTIHAWRRARRKNEEGDNNQNSGANFIEVGIKGDVKDREKIKLKKIELVYEKYRIEIVGEISSEKITPIIKILERE